jgi:hypothetical protein
LRDFGNLTHLVVENYADKSGDRSLVPFVLINQCVHLIEFDYCSDIFIPEDIADTSYNNITSRI